MGNSIYCIGETVFDIIFNENNIVAGKPGGSMLNSSVSMGVANLPVKFISEFGLDPIGDIINQYLLNNGVDTKYSIRYQNPKTTLALAFLDGNKNATYHFYRDSPKNNPEIPKIEFHSGDILLFGSFYAISPDKRNLINTIVNQALEEDVFIIYDPNYRKAHLHELNILKPFIIENISKSNLVKGSEEDFNMIFNANNLEDAYQSIYPYCKNLIYTRAEKGMYFKNTQTELFLESENIIPISTIGAGDNFSAGLIYWLFKNNVNNSTFGSLNTEEINQLLKMGREFSTFVCKTYENTISESFVKTLLVK